MYVTLELNSKLLIKAENFDQLMSVLTLCEFKEQRYHSGAGYKYHPLPDDTQREPYTLSFISDKDIIEDKEESKVIQKLSEELSQKSQQVYNLTKVLEDKEKALLALQPPAPFVGECSDDVAENLDYQFKIYYNLILTYLV